MRGSLPQALPARVRTSACAHPSSQASLAATLPQTSSTRRRALLLSLPVTLLARRAVAAVSAPESLARPPLLSDYAGDERLTDAQRLFTAALDAHTVVEEEAGWTALIDKYGSCDAPWAPTLIAGVLGNRGNARSRQGKLRQAIEDYDAAVALAPYAVDPILNRGVVLEQLGEFDAAIADYERVLALSPADPAAFNNRGNAKMGKRDYTGAAKDYGRAVQLSPSFAFAGANRAVALFAAGERIESMRSMRALLRRYPDFPEVRAALAAALWAEGSRAQAETEWLRVDDARYKDRAWLRADRRWPQPLADALEALLDIRAA